MEHFYYPSVFCLQQKTAPLTRGAAQRFVLNLFTRDFFKQIKAEQ